LDFQHVEAPLEINARDFPKLSEVYVRTNCTVSVANLPESATKVSIDGATDLAVLDDLDLTRLSLGSFNVEYLDLTPFVKLRTLKLYDMPDLTSVVLPNTISHLHIKHCPALTKVTGLSSMTLLDFRMFELWSLRSIHLAKIQVKQLAHFEAQDNRLDANLTTFEDTFSPKQVCRMSGSLQLVRN
jgi:hypothetical protein